MFPYGLRKATNKSTSLSPTDESWPTSTNDNDTTEHEQNEQYKQYTDSDYSRINEIPATLSIWNARPSGDRRHRAKSVHDLLVKWAKFAKRQSEMHDMSWAYFKSWNLSSAIISTVIVSASGLVTIGLGQRPTSCTEGTTPTSIPIIVAGAMSLVGSTIMAVNKLLAYGEIQQQHDIYSDSYEIMYNDIALNMTLGKSSHRMFNNDSEFIKYLKYKMDQLIDRAPPITNYIRKQYEDKNPQVKRWRRSRDYTPILTKTVTQLHMEQALSAAAAAASADASDAIALADSDPGPSSSSAATAAATAAATTGRRSAGETTQEGIDRRDRFRLQQQQSEQQQQQSEQQRASRSLDDVMKRSYPKTRSRRYEEPNNRYEDNENTSPPLALSVYTSSSAAAAAAAAANTRTPSYPATPSVARSVAASSSRPPPHPPHPPHPQVAVASPVAYHTSFLYAPGVLPAEITAARGRGGGGRGRGGGGKTTPSTTPTHWHTSQIANTLTDVTNITENPENMEIQPYMEDTDDTEASSENSERDVNTEFNVELYRIRNQPRLSQPQIHLHPHPHQGRPKPQPEYSST